jgi:caffeoyl-CoA O-methyltransferase
MTTRTGPWIDPNIVDYLRAHTTPPDEVINWITEQTVALGKFSAMQIGSDQVALMTLLTRLIGATNAVEVGTFTGTSALAIARGLADGGRLLCCDVSEEWTGIAREGWKRAGVADRIDLRIAPALDTLRALPSEPTIDLVFVDADKPNYSAYLAELIPRVRQGGLVLVDNTIWYGQVINTAVNDPDTVAIRKVNDELAADVRLDSVIVPIGDGLTVCRKR